MNKTAAFAAKMAWRAYIANRWAIVADAAILTLLIWWLL